MTKENRQKKKNQRSSRKTWKQFERKLKKNLSIVFGKIYDTLYMMGKILIAFSSIACVPLVIVDFERTWAYALILVCAWSCYWKYFMGELDNISRRELENNTKLFVSRYDDMILYTEGFETGAMAWVIDEEKDGAIYILQVVKCIRRSDNIRTYDNMTDDDLLRHCNTFEYTGEFITDNDTYYVFFDYEM